jgi:hypothetical protein
VGGLVFALAVWANGGWKSRDATPGDERATGADFVYVVLMIAAAAGLVWSSVRLKRVTVDDDALYISNYKTEIRIPLTEVLEVKECRRSDWFVLALDLKHPTAFGQHIVFPPRFQLYWSGLHPVAKELKALVDEAKKRQEAQQMAAGRPIGAR